MDDLVSRSGTTAEEVLFVLNGQRTVPLDRIMFAVITGTYTPHVEESQEWPFVPGEILPVIYDGHRNSQEFLGRGRPDPMDWEGSGGCTHYASNLAQARLVADLVLSERPRGYYQWTDDGLTYAADQHAARWAWGGDPDGWVRVGDREGHVPFGAGGHTHG